MENKVRTLIHKQETLTLRLFDHVKPTIAALPGVAAGAGMCIALACDIRIAAASSFVTTAYRNIGFSGDYGGSWLLNQLVGPAKTKELYFTGRRRVHADEALALGIFNQVVDDKRLSGGGYRTGKADCLRSSHRLEFHETQHQQCHRRNTTGQLSPRSRCVDALCGHRRPQRSRRRIYGEKTRQSFKAANQQSEIKLWPNGKTGPDAYPANRIN